MNKVEMADRLAARTGMSKAAARDAVDSVFARVHTVCCELVSVVNLLFGAQVRRRAAL